MRLTIILWYLHISSLLGRLIIGKTQHELIIFHF